MDWQRTIVIEGVEEQWHIPVEAPIAFEQAGVEVHSIALEEEAAEFAPQVAETAPSILRTALGKCEVTARVKNNCI